MDVMKPQNKKDQSPDLIELYPEHLTHTQGAETKNTDIKQYLCVRRSIPKTALSHVILNENMSQDRHLVRKLTDLSSRKIKASNANDLTQRTFIAMQDRKQKKWRRDDEVRLSSMNFPFLHVNERQPPQDLEVVYHLSQFNVQPPPKGRNMSADQASRLPKMPFSIRKEQTELVIYNKTSYMTKLPEVQVVDNEALKHYDWYRGKTMLVTGQPRTDARFKRLENLLRPAHLKESDHFSRENVQSVSRLSKYSYNTYSLDDDDENEPSKRPNVLSRERPFSKMQRSSTMEMPRSTTREKQGISTREIQRPVTKDNHVISTTKEVNNTPTTKDSRVFQTRQANTPTASKDRYVPLTKEANLPSTNKVPTKEKNIPPTRETNAPETRETHIPSTREAIAPTTREGSDQSWMITRLDSASDVVSKPPSRGCLALPNKTELAKKQTKKSVRILEEFKSGDVKQLAKNLKKQRKNDSSEEIQDLENVDVSIDI